MYTTDDFKPGTMHAFKFLWLFERRTELIKQHIMESNSDNLFEVLPSAFISANERVQIETGLSTDDLATAMLIGTYIAEYREMTKMTEEELKEYMEFMEDPRSVDPEIMEQFETAFTTYRSMSLDSNSRKAFEEIIKLNFKEGEQ